MLIESVLRIAQPYLQGRKVRDLVVGVSLMAVELDNGDIGISYVLRDELQAGCSIFPFGQQVIGEEAADIAQWVVTGGDSLQKAIGVAVLVAASRQQKLEDAETLDRPFGVTVKDTDTVGMIGFIPPVAKMIGARAKELYVFDKGISQCGGKKGSVLPMKEQSRLLPTCDIVALSGTTMINGSIDGILKMCEHAREIIMIGASTPMFPAAFANRKITVIAGSWWDSQHKNSIFKKISLACGISELSSYAIKKSVRVSP
ncbi:Rossmann-like domain-containing protein [Clostridium formicaceticum]|uniref:Heavy-metal chelation domain-containing protein n=1 Tax=Clostridium formicaceticum TaxID=1497 RepID=A0AAC9WFE1_9CLOT|nr:DUF364 domain-containing protein [Clostridium formicaceticum]AOY76281.1 hypothetical protein BJL90_10435 [Clostridium formicaceticum]ARE86668.1 hypothetical protein CLFO_09940 [Clostridium formicaceticum]